MKYAVTLKLPLESLMQQSNLSTTLGTSPTTRSALSLIVTDKPMTKGRAEQIVGRLSNPAKMPAKAWGIDARLCKTGSRLRKIKGTACSACYACKGNYCRTNVRDAMARRLRGSKHPRWAEAMKVMIEHNTPIAVPYFRWFDSGDLQSYSMLLDIMWIAAQLPEINFWMPTSERRYLTKLKREHRVIPPNLIIRYSSPLIDVTSDKWPTTSKVVTDGTESCFAHLTGGNCQDCRNCWDHSVTEIRYRKH